MRLPCSRWPRLPACKLTFLNLSMYFVAAASTSSEVAYKYNKEERNPELELNGQTDQRD